MKDVEGVTAGSSAASVPGSSEGEAREIELDTALRALVREVAQAGIEWAADAATCDETRNRLLARRHMMAEEVEDATFGNLIDSPVPELEAVRALLNPALDRGVSDPQPDLSVATKVVGGAATTREPLKCKACGCWIPAVPDQNQLRVYFRCPNIACDEYGRDVAPWQWFQQYTAALRPSRPAPDFNKPLPCKDCGGQAACWCNMPAPPFDTGERPAAAAPIVKQTPELAFQSEGATESPRATEAAGSSAGVPTLTFEHSFTPFSPETVAIADIIEIARLEKPTNGTHLVTRGNGRFTLTESYESVCRRIALALDPSPVVATPVVATEATRATEAAGSSAGDEPLKFPDDMPEVGSYWTHRKHNRTYNVVARAFVEATLQAVVVYRYRNHNACWVRPVADFLSRFTPALGPSSLAADNPTVATKPCHCYTGTFDRPSIEHDMDCECKCHGVAPNISAAEVQELVAWCERQVAQQIEDATAYPLSAVDCNIRAVRFAKIAAALRTLTQSTQETGR